MVELLSFQFLTTLTLVTFCFDFYSDILKSYLYKCIFVGGHTIDDKAILGYCICLGTYLGHIYFQVKF